ncbi:LOW QUALITY PROTEIN: zinc finger B-box domain-containing protein 1-like [Puntigrus tetrazona]|uniref:LOW QUALITY PROTEIN: zinc finger B-box domain-containing protein 1-like n=1 Tax=Puntigrus tetrazona TaxID=1606681 RepID=UPI001C89A72C|nr:LOW QUALITY PROTEIN: zinc finger B-box domain-containing protein 1-like [Puntigrus tetrazona]
MNLNNFVVLPSKPKSMKLNVRNLRELRMETVQLDQHAKEMESRLEELRQRMNREKEEREKTGASLWRSAQPGIQSVRLNKENAPHRLSPGKMKIRVLKDEPVPAVQKQVIVEPATKVQSTNKKLNLRGKVCGQCEVQPAGLMCAECGEDYCVGCFVRFHQKGALKRHRTVPVQAELQTPVSTRDVLGCLQRQVSGEENQHTRGASRKSADESEATERRSAPRSLQPMSDNQMQHTQPQVLFVNDVVDVEDEEAAEEEDSSLLRGGFDEEESARSFQEALKEWRERGQRPVSVMETQTEKGSQQLLHVEFKEDTLSYMEKLLLKKHRRGQIEEFQPRSVVQHRPEPLTPPPTEIDELSRKVTAERMELHKYFASLFSIAPAEDAGKADSPAESCLSIAELDEMVEDPTIYRSSGVKQGNESKMFAAVGKEGDLGYSVLPSIPLFSEVTKGSVSECDSEVNITSSPEMWPLSQEPEQSSSSLPRSESFFHLRRGFGDHSTCRLPQNPLCQIHEQEARKWNSVTLQNQAHGQDLLQHGSRSNPQSFCQHHLLHFQKPN